MTHAELTVRKLRHPIKVRRVTVGRITELTPAMRRITFIGDELQGFYSASFDDHAKLLFPPQPGGELVLPTVGPNGMLFEEGVARPIMRDYTPRRFDESRLELDIDFVLQHSGPATDWAATAKVGDELGIGGPRGSFVIPTGFDWHVLIGDETAMPAIGRRIEELPLGSQAIVLIKTRDAASRIEFEGRCEVQTTWILDEPEQSQGAEPLERAVRALTLPADGEGYIWAAGEYAPIQKIREYLVKEKGVAKDRIRASSYWRKASPATHVTFD